MYVRTIARRNKDGSSVRYVQLAQNERDEHGVTRANVLYSFGREDQLDTAALRRLVQSICRFLEPADAAQAQLQLQGVGMALTDSRPLGGAWLLDQLWHRIGIDRVLGKLLGQRRYRAELERLLFAMVANCALAPSSKLSITDWVAEEAAIPGLESVPLPQADEVADRRKVRKRRVNPMYEAMDFLLTAEEQIQREVYWATADLLRLQVDLLFVDTTTTYFETEAPDGQGIRRFGHTKDHRADRPQVVIGLAVTRDGIPVRCWVWPGNTNDMSVISQVKADLIGWKLGRVVMVVDRGFTSEDNLREMQRAGGHYIAGEKLRSGKADTEVALGRQGRYHSVADNIEVKEIVIGEGEARQRFILVRNPKEVERDRQRREQILTELRDKLAELGPAVGQPHSKATCALRTHERYGPYLITDAKGRLKIDAAKVRAETRLDGKYLLRTSDDTLSAEDVALGYRQLAEIEDAFRTLKSELDIRPVYHRLEERIRAHVLLHWLALLLVRVAEADSGHRWTAMRREFQRMHLVTYAGTGGTVRQRTELTTFQQQILATLKLSKPPKIFSIKGSSESSA